MDKILKLKELEFLLDRGAIDQNEFTQMKSEILGSAHENAKSLASPEEIKIGLQTWAKKNIDVSTFRNGDAIPCAESDAEWVEAGEQGQPAWCFYDNDPINGKIFGKLYNWYAVHDKRGLAPAGWNVPSDSEWKRLTDFLGGEEIAGTKIKSTSGWNENGNGNNASGFSALPGGVRYDDGSYKSNGSYGYWWSSIEFNTSLAWFRYMGYDDGQFYRGYDGKRAGFSVRCLRD